MKQHEIDFGLEYFSRMRPLGERILGGGWGEMRQDFVFGVSC